MSLLTQLPTERYQADAAAGFRATGNFEVGTARALAWLSQFAYETDPAKIREIGSKLDVTLIGDPIHRRVSTPLPIASTYAMVLDLGAAVVVAFAGTDPAVLANWITDFDIRPADGGAAEGLVAAMRVVEPDIVARLPSGRPIMVTGHSIGGALAVLLADRLATMGRDVLAIYTFGMTRPGRRDFADRYNRSALAGRTYRLVHGEDIVATTPPSEPFGFRHVGRYAPVPRGGKIKNAGAGIGSDEPGFVHGITQELSDFFHNPLAEPGVFAEQLRPDAATRLDPAGIIIELLPPRLRDHVPERYIAACSP